MKFFAHIEIELDADDEELAEVILDGIIAEIRSFSGVDDAWLANLEPNE